MDQNPGGVLFLLIIALTATLTYSTTADHLPAPIHLTSQWLDPFILKLSWKMPPDLPKDCRPTYIVEELDKERRPTQVAENQTFSQYFLSEKMKSGPFMLSVAAECLGLKSKAANITIGTNPPHAELVKNFRCFEDHPKECTWTPLDSTHLTFHYRHCGRSEEKLHDCVQQSEEHVCYMNQRDLTRDVCVVVNSATHMNTLKPERAVHVPPLNITVEGNSLRLTWTPSDVRRHWLFDLWYKECDQPKEPLTFQENTFQIPYDPCCIYDFQYRVRCTGSETPISSSNSSVLTYGSGKCYNAAIIVAIVAPILLFFCVLLSCYCFRRHKDIICPIVPYPSNLLKELMNGTKDPGKPTSLLTTDQEVLDDVKVFLVNDRTSQQRV